MSSPLNRYTPSELNREVRLHLEAGFPRLWVEGEISNLARPASGHLYFTLKDDKAQIRCALFRGNARSLTFRPENGQQVLLRGRLGLYEPRGEYQLIADQLEAAGEGALRAAYEKLKHKLELEGLFSEARKQPLPALPRTIAVITSPSGAVIRDIIHVLERRWPLAKVRLYPVPVQGEAAAPAMCRALEAVNRHGDADAIILGRGGGSLEDLWAFNEETVARAISASAIPVVSAVGHETDFSIADFVADLRAPTPSAAAEQLTPDLQVLRQAFDRAFMHLGQRISSALQRRSQRLDELGGRLQQQHPQRRLQQQHEILDRLSQRLSVSAERLVVEQERRLEPLRVRLRQALGRLLPARRERLAALARTLHAVSPLPTMERGYSVTLPAGGGRSIRQVSQVKVGDEVVTRLLDGQFSATVQSVSPADRAAGPGENARVPKP